MALATCWSSAPHTVLDGRIHRPRLSPTWFYLQSHLRICSLGHLRLNLLCCKMQAYSAPPAPKTRSQYRPKAKGRLQQFHCSHVCTYSQAQLHHSHHHPYTPAVSIVLLHSAHPNGFRRNRGPSNCTMALATCWSSSPDMVLGGNIRKLCLSSKRFHHWSHLRIGSLGHLRLNLLCCNLLDYSLVEGTDLY